MHVVSRIDAYDIRRATGNMYNRSGSSRTVVSMPVARDSCRNSDFLVPIWRQLAS